MSSPVSDPVPQFDVFTNPGRQRDAIPFVVALQNGRYEHAPTRLVAALISARAIAVEEHHLAPRFTVLGRPVVLDVFNLATVPAARLGPVMASLADEDSRARLGRALDEFLSQA
ncbi:CcdB family protein [Teichococcus vastitatis]|uniref:Toxin CcdB n=1 Tax=Teichococcus vastitatis TaxID=2307076 RepID=A0ABS9W7R6_9PROT|nr:CcdB family protein [Pseudoroseomonas vastitatis]MCI0755263.1 CcdB family protein [Pseudoroseomonas vastitatis]